MNSPGFFLSPLVAAAAKKISVRPQAVNPDGLLPLHASEPVFARAFHFRRYLQKALPAWAPSKSPVANGPPSLRLHLIHLGLEMDRPVSVPSQFPFSTPSSGEDLPYH